MGRKIVLFCTNRKSLFSFYFNMLILGNVLVLFGVEVFLVGERGCLTNNSLLLKNLVRNSSFGWMLCYQACYYIYIYLCITSNVTYVILEMLTNQADIIKPSILTWSYEFTTPIATIIIDILIHKWHSRQLYI